MKTNEVKKEKSGHAHAYVVSVFEENTPSALWTRVWHASAPLGIGYPFRWVLEKTKDGFRFRKVGGAFEAVINDPFFYVDLKEIEKPIFLENVTIRIKPSFELTPENANALTYIPDPISTPIDLKDKGQFKKVLNALVGVTVVMALLVHFMPVRKKEDELIPPQFAKVLLTPQVKPKEKMDARSSNEKKNENNVVKAFKSEAVQKSASNLFKGGAAKALLGKSKLFDTAGANAAVKDVFGQKSNLVGSLQVAQGNTLDPKASKVGLLGGSGGGSGGVGYGNATVGTVAGQGGGGIAFSTEGLDVDEGLTKDEVGRVIRQHVSEVRYCYEAAMVRNPGFEGKFVAAFVILPSGAVKTAKAKESSGDAGLDNCILSRLVKWAFPKPRKGVEVSVSYPFIFKSLN